ncbi:hypothetical protein TNCV_2787541 [Trichonephila clavipes]|uniref:Uncharacterized protein n=1 Tax=Trichonephila clavipes TaxID=2585209 RepID=A0A8X6VPU0_TRICX|nr:hypothetical protein TNCV_2787541 [Trichonephila clavipes]
MTQSACEENKCERHLSRCCGNRGQGRDAGRLRGVEGLAEGSGMRRESTEHWSPQLYEGVRVKFDSHCNSDFLRP